MVAILSRLQCVNIHNQAIKEMGVDLLPVEPKGTNFCEILVKIYKFPPNKMHSKSFLLNVGHFLQFKSTYDDVMTWKHFLYYWPFVRGIHC